MTYQRRSILLGLAALGMTACGRTALSTADAPDPALIPRPEPGWQAWVQGFKARAAAAGISPSVTDRAFARAGFLPGVIERDRNQTEVRRTLEDYLQIAAGADKVALGRQEYAARRATFDAIEARFGVPGPVVAAVWGLESRYGTRTGDIPVISAMSTLAYDGRRGAFFESQLIAALRILQAGDTTPEQMLGSWAGAMGHTQFMPASFLENAVDFTGDGRRDIWGPDPTDSLASTANYLARAGWRQGQPWGIEVRLPAGFDTGLIGRGKDRSTADWAASGVRDARGGTLPDHGAGSVLVPQDGGPAFLVYRNFTVISRYNNSVSYVIGVGHLSDRIAGRGPLLGSFPPDANGMTLADRQALQSGLTRAGFNAGTPDGVIGSKTIAAIENFQRARGLPVTGTPTPALVSLVN